MNAQKAKAFSKTARRKPKRRFFLAPRCRFAATADFWRE
jgi:hypothetical protein